MIRHEAGWVQLQNTEGVDPDPSYTVPETEIAGLKYDSEKPRTDLLISDMPRALEAVSQVLTFGAEKYSPGNWQYVENADSRYLAAALRHEMALARGEQNDPETGVHHLAHVACCVLFRLELAMREAAR
nr:dATP/dGTP diphosphohydrolase domain-containing protein [Halomonas litopenaei]